MKNIPDVATMVDSSSSLKSVAIEFVCAGKEGVYTTNVLDAALAFIAFLKGHMSGDKLMEFLTPLFTGHEEALQGIAGVVSACIGGQGV